MTVKNLTQIRFGTTINVALTEKIRRNVMRVEKVIFGILLHVVLKMVQAYAGRYTGGLIDNSAIMRDEIMETTKSILT